MRAKTVVTTILGAAAVVFLLASCIGIETTYTFKKDGSGTAEFKYKISQMVRNLGSQEGEDKKEVPLPISDEEFRAAVDAAEGVTMVGAVQQHEDEDNIYIDATVAFDKVESLSSMKDFQDMPATLERDGKGWVFRQVVSPGKGKDDPELDADTMKMIETLFSGYKIVFEVNAPSRIVSTTLGDVTGNKVRYEISMPELMKTKEQTVLEVRW